MKKIIIFFVILSLLMLPLVTGCEDKSAQTGDKTANENSISDNGFTFGPKLSLGAFYYPWYSKARNAHWKDGYLRQKLDTPQETYLGEYNSEDVKTVEQQIKSATDYGIDYFMISWFGPKSVEDYNIKDVFLKAKNVSDIKFGILFESPGIFHEDFSFSKEIEDKLKTQFEYLATKYFNQPNYLKYQGKPIVYFYLSRSFDGDYDIVMKNVREYIKEKFSIEMFFIGDEAYYGGIPTDKKFSVLDASSAYNVHSNMYVNGYAGPSNFLSHVETLFKDNTEYAADFKKNFIPSVIPGFNDKGIRSGNAPLPREINKGEEGKETLLSEMLELAYKYKDPALNTILITSWNEWHEDTQIEPTKETGSITNKPEEFTYGYSYAPYGFKDLEIVKAFKDKYSK